MGGMGGSGFDFIDANQDPDLALALRYCASLAMFMFHNFPGQMIWRKFVDRLSEDLIFGEIVPYFCIHLWHLTPAT